MSSYAVVAALAAVAAIAAPELPAPVPNCFVPLDEPLLSLPFNDSEVAAMRRYFKANLNVRGTGAVVASPGECPALLACCSTCTGGYAYDWTRDGAISIAALQKVGRSALATLGDSDHVTSGYVRETVQAYARWVGRRRGHNKAGTEDVYLEPKWNITTGQPYGGGWCRPQTDGPGLRAMALMQYARHQWSSFESRLRAMMAPNDGWSVDRSHLNWLWSIIRKDLDWIAQQGYNRSTCDLWEETMDGDLLWNRMTMRAALLHGQRFARDVQDLERAELYGHAAEVRLGDPLAGHTDREGFLTECATTGGGLGCRLKRKQIDGSVILSLIHDGRPIDPMVQAITAPPAARHTSVAVARTVLRYNEAFCEAYPINRKDTADGVPGVLYGRYSKDMYGKGNPWVLITASLATLLYRAAHAVQEGHSLSPEEVRMWRLALNHRSFSGLGRDFIAAGDAVLLRIAHHVRLDGGHLYEQIDKNSGRQYNARDLTWSYAEVLVALVERGEALDGMGTPTLV